MKTGAGETEPRERRGKKRAASTGGHLDDASKGPKVENGGKKGSPVRRFDHVRRKEGDHYV